MFLCKAQAIVNRHKAVHINPADRGGVIVPAVVLHRPAVSVHLILDQSPGIRDTPAIRHGHIEYFPIGNVVQHVPASRLLHHRHVSLRTIGIIPASHIITGIVILFIK